MLFALVTAGRQLAPLRLGRKGKTAGIDIDESLRAESHRSIKGRLDILRLRMSSAITSMPKPRASERTRST